MTRNLYGFFIIVGVLTTDFIIAQSQQSGFPGPLSFQSQQQQNGQPQQGQFLPGGSNGQMMGPGQPMQQGGQFQSGQFNQLPSNGLQPQQQQPNQFGTGPNGIQGQGQQQLPGQFPNGGLSQQFPGAGQNQQSLQQQPNLSPFAQQPPLGSQVQPQQFGGNPAPTASAGAPMVKITTDLNNVERATSTEQVIWQQPQSLPIYCVSQSPAQELTFTCLTCNNTQLDQELARNTQQMANYAGYPAIKLNPMLINGEFWDKQRLACLAFYQGPSSERLNTTALTFVNVIYLARPQILDQTGHKPLIEGGEGSRGRFYVPQNSALTLYCVAKGNPPASTFQWTLANQVVSASPQIQIGPQYAGSTISCRASNQNTQQGQNVAAPNVWQTSDDVIIEVLAGPNLMENNFESVVKGAKDTTTGKVPIGKTVSLQCAAGASSKPFILWKQQSAPSRIVNASCEGGPRIVQETRANPSGWIVKSECNLRFDGYEKAGEYFCAACSFIADNNTFCYPSLTSMPSTYAAFDLSGPPSISPYYRTEYIPNSDRLTLYFTYCSDPQLSANDLYFTVDKERLNLNNRLSGGAVQAGMPQQNQTYSRCYDIPLAFDSSATAGRYRSVQLNANYGSSGQPVQQTFYISEAVNNPWRNDTYVAGNSGYNPTALILGLLFGIVSLVIIILVAFLWYKQKACFAPKKPPNKTTKIGGKAGKYQSNLATTQLRPEVAQEKSTPLTRPNTNGFNPERVNTHNSGYSPNGRRAHEGMTYSEFDLVKDSAARLASSGPRPVEYARMQPVPPSSSSNHMKSPTNSVV